MTELKQTTVHQTVDPAAERTAPPAPPPSTGAMEERRTVVSERAARYPTGWATAVRLVTLLFGILQGLLVLRLVLLLLAAQQDNAIVSAILASTEPFVGPFRGMFRIDEISSSGSILDVAAITALVGWTLVEALIIAILRLAGRRAD
jgi:uncharacterized protein YggT (Ycf19 family)